MSAPPAESGSFNTVGDALADGRLIAATGYSVYIETGVGTGQFDLAATIDSGVFSTAPDPAFISVSPDGLRVALGGGFDSGSGATRPILVFDSTVFDAPGVETIDASNASAFDIEHFGGSWANSSEIALSAGAFGSPSRVDLLDVTTGATRTVVSNIQGSSAGVAFDSAGRLYTGNGFELGTPGASTTGTVKAFESTDWSQLGGVDFENDGVVIVDALSASSLSIDSFGNLFIGGGDFNTGDFGYAGIVNAEAIADALLGGGAANTALLSEFKQLNPAGSGYSFYSTFVNDLTGELVLSDGSSWFVTVPAPGAAALCCAGVSTLLWRRRRAA